MAFPLPLSAYPQPSATVWATLADRIALEPFNLVATGLFALALIHTFAASRITRYADRVQHRHDEDARRRGRTAAPSVAAELLHLFGEVEVVFGVWALVLLAVMTWYGGWEAARHYVSDTVVYTEAIFVVVVMALASTRPVITLAEHGLTRLAAVGGHTPGAWWMATLVVGPLLGSLVTEPAAMTICALVLARQFYDLQPSARLKYATLGLLFVNVSIGGTLTHFAAPPVLMVARAWNWDTSFMLAQFGWRAVLAIVGSTLLYYGLFRREFAVLARRPAVVDRVAPHEDADGAVASSVPAWITAVHVAFLAWTVVNAHYPALFVGGFLFFLGFARATAVYQDDLRLKAPLLVGFFLGGLVIHGGLQGWWIEPLLRTLSDTPLFLGATALTAFNDNALITYLATLLPQLGDGLKVAVVQGAVVGGGLTVVANAPNPAGQALLAPFFDDAVSPLGLAVAALAPTLVAAACLRLL